VGTKLGGGVWPLHDVVTINIVWCMAYKRRVGAGRVLRNSVAIVLESCGQCRWAGQDQEGCLVQESFGVNEYLVKGGVGWISS